MNIRFGTSGWRGIIADDFTFQNVKIATAAIGEHIIAKGGKSIVVGYDTRFMAEDFARAASQVLAAYGIKVYLSSSDIPTPVIAHAILRKSADGGINFTASHNDYYYHGMKFSNKSGGPALPEETTDIEKRIEEMIKRNMPIKEIKFEESKKRGLIETFYDNKYYKDIMKLVDFTPLTDKKISVVYDALFGTGRLYLPRMLDSFTNLLLINGDRDPLFGNIHPEPIEENLKVLIKYVRRFHADIGLATDGDADRFGIVDKGGRYISPNKILAIIYYYLLNERGMKGNVVRSVATTSMLDRIAHHFGYKCIETPVGFKYIGDEIVKGNAIFGGEESGGATMQGWLPEKDGILIDLLVTEIVAKKRKRLSSLFRDLTSKFGEVYSERIDYTYETDVEITKKKLRENALNISKTEPVNSIQELDGIKIMFSNGEWLLFRFSGTEKKIRAYCESGSSATLNRLKSLANTVVYASIEGNY